MLAHLWLIADDRQKMQPRYATGSGEPPRHVSQFRRRSTGGVIVVEGSGRAENIAFRDDDELVAECRALIQSKVAFSVGGHVPGPADELEIWQDQGKLADPFIRISWRAPKSWMLHEIFPGGKLPWSLVETPELTG